MNKRTPPHRPKTELQMKRIFSEAFRRERVSEIERGMLTVKEVCRIYHVSSAAVYRWIHAYSQHLQHHTRQVVELESEQHRTKLLLERVATLEQALGQKQLLVDILQRAVENAAEELGPDWKKKLSSLLWNGIEPSVRREQL
jgi:transposase